MSSIVNRIAVEDGADFDGGHGSGKDLPKPRNLENIGLPERWQFTHGAYFYRVPPGHEPFWGHKQRYMLGKTFDEALAAFRRVAATQPEEGFGSPPYKLQSVAGIVGLSAQRPAGGVYFLIDGGEIVYIGRSDNVLARIASHEVRFTHWHHIPCHGLEQERLEQLYIAEFAPRFNIYVGGRSPANVAFDLV